MESNDAGCANLPISRTQSAIVRSGAMAVVAGLSATTQGRLAIIAQEPDPIPILVNKVSAGLFLLNP